MFAERASPLKDPNDDSYSSKEFEVVGMTVGASKALGWRKTESRGVQSDCDKGKVLNVHSRLVCAHSLSHGE